MKISVAMCTYNGEHYLSEQLLSILSQSTPVQEIIIYDDQSSDATQAIVEDFQQRFPGIIKFTINKNRQFARKNFEQAIASCTGDFIFLSDQDDVWVLDKVKSTLGFFASHPNADGVFTNGYFLDNNVVNTNKTIWGGISFSNNLQQVANADNLLLMLLKLNNFVTGAALCIKSTAKAYLFPFHCPKPLYWHDYWIALQIASHNRLYFLNEMLIHYRVHSAQQIGFSQLKPDNEEATFKEAIWKDAYLEVPTSASMPFVAGAIQRSEFFKPLISTDVEGKVRVEGLIATMKKGLELIMKKHFNELGFLGRKKLFIKSLQRSDKYFYFTLKQKIRLLLS